MADAISIDQAYWAVSHPATSAAALQAIASRYHDLWPKIAAHPNVTPALLDWLDATGDPATQAAVAARRSVPQLPVFQRPTVVGSSKAGAMVAGALMLLLVLLSILSRTAIQQWGLDFGSLPVLNVFLDSCSFNNTCTVDTMQFLYVMSFVIVTLVWLGLGIVIMAGAKNHLAKVALAGLCAFFLFNTIPTMSVIIPEFPGLAYGVPPSLYATYFIYAVALLAIPAALLLMALGTRRGQLNPKPLLTWAIILLSIGALLQVVLSAITLWNMPSEIRSSITPHYVFQILMLVPWIILAATVGVPKQPRLAVPAMPLAYPAPLGTA